MQTYPNATLKTWRCVLPSLFGGLGVCRQASLENMEWDKAEHGELKSPLLPNEEPPHPARRRTEAVSGGGDVPSMLRELSGLVRQLKRRPDNKLLASAWVVAESIQACLRPPNPANLSGSQRRELRSCLVTLQQMGNQNSQAHAAGSFAALPEESKSMEIEQPTRRQLVLQEEEVKSYDDELDAMRERDIANLNTRVTTVNQIFTDIAGLITNQQEEVDSIESAIDTAHTRTNKGQEQLIRAERRRTAKMKCCFYFAVGLTIFAIFLILAIIGFKNIAGTAVAGR